VAHSSDTLCSRQPPLFSAADKRSSTMSSPSRRRKHDNSDDSASKATDTFDPLCDVRDDGSKNGIFASADRTQSLRGDTCLLHSRWHLINIARPSPEAEPTNDARPTKETKVEGLETFTEMPDRIHAINSDDVLDQANRLPSLVRNTIYAQITPAIKPELVRSSAGPISPRYLAPFPSRSDGEDSQHAARNRRLARLGGVLPYQEAD